MRHTATPLRMTAPLFGLGLCLAACAASITGNGGTQVDAAAPQEDMALVLGQRCDANHPCPFGATCVEGTCHIDCGGPPRCGNPEVCCKAGEVCTPQGCVAPGDACAPAPGCGGAGVATCPMGWYCDALISHCLPKATVMICTVPPVSDFKPVEYWHWTGNKDHPEYKGVLVTPLVADVNHDGAGDVLVVAYKDPPMNFGGSIPAYSILCALSGPGDCAGNPHEIFCTDPADTAHLLNAWGNIAVGDLDSTDGVDSLTIVAGLQNDPSGALGITAFDEKGKPLWIGHDKKGAKVDVFVYIGGVAIADLDGDGKAEVIVGATVFDNKGLLLWSAPGTHNGNSNTGPLSIAADLDGAPDGHLEVISGNSAFKSDGTLLWTSPDIGDGFPAVADFDGDGKPEVVVVSNSSVAILTAAGKVFAPAVSFGALGFSGRGGAPTVADIDKDGHPEIGIAGADGYVTLKVKPAGNGWALSKFWLRPANDQSSNITGSAMFDFDGDGIFEVIYQDTCRARVFDGRDGHDLMNIENSSGTATNYPTVADLNGDGRAEFILVADSYYARTYPNSAVGCPMNQKLLDGVRVFHDANDNWQTTRAVWNEHSYHVTNVCDGVDSACAGAANRQGAIPKTEKASWGAGLNAFRVNARYGLSAHDAPDLLPLSVGADESSCPTQLTVRADIANRGAAAVAAGTPVAIFDGDPMGQSTLLGVVMTQHAIPPGGVERVTLVYMNGGLMARTFHIYVIAGDDGQGHRTWRECDTTNNVSVPIVVGCSGIG